MAIDHDEKSWVLPAFNIKYPIHMMYKDVPDSSPVGLVAAIHRYPESLHLRGHLLGPQSIIRLRRRNNRLVIESNIVTVVTDSPDVSGQRGKRYSPHATKRMTVAFPHVVAPESNITSHNTLEGKLASIRSRWTLPSTTVLSGEVVNWGRSASQLEMWRKCVKWNKRRQMWDHSQCQKKSYNADGTLTVCSCLIGKPDKPISMAVIREVGPRKTELDFYHSNIAVTVFRYIGVVASLVLVVAATRRTGQSWKLVNASTMLTSNTMNLCWSIVASGLLDMISDIYAVRHIPNINLFVSILGVYWRTATFVWLVIVAISTNQVIFTGIISGKEEAHNVLGFGIPLAMLAALFLQYPETMGFEWHCNVAADASAKQLCLYVFMALIVIAALIHVVTVFHVYLHKDLPRIRQRGMVPILQQYFLSHVGVIAMVGLQVILMRVVQAFGLGDSDGLIGEPLFNGDAGIYWGCETFRIWISLAVVAVAIYGGRLTSKPRDHDRLI